MLEFFQKFPRVSAVMSEREDGSMKLLDSGQEANLENRARFFQKAGLDPARVFAAEIVHGAKIEAVGVGDARIALGVDGLLAQEKNIFLSVTIADCIPLFLYEPEKKIVGILHCGWRGIMAGIVPEALEKISKMGGSAENLQAAIGPGIGSCHFEIKEDVLESFKNYPENVLRRNGKIFVDLKGIMRKQLSLAGVREENIENNADCTMENEKYFSHRRDRPRVPEAMVAIIGMKG